MDMTFIFLVIGWLTALIMGIVNYKHSQRKPDGAIVINMDDPEKDTYTLELYIPFGELDTRGDVTFRIIHQ